MLQQPERRQGAWNELVKAQSIRTGVDNKWYLAGHLDKRLPTA